MLDFNISQWVLFLGMIFYTCVYSNKFLTDFKNKTINLDYIMIIVVWYLTIHGGTWTNAPISSFYYAKNMINGLFMVILGYYLVMISLQSYLKHRINKFENFNIIFYCSMEETVRSFIISSFIYSMFILM